MRRQSHNTHKNGENGKDHLGKDEVTLSACNNCTNHVEGHGMGMWPETQRPSGNSSARVFAVERNVLVEDGNTSGDGTIEGASGTS